MMNGVTEVLLIFIHAWMMTVNGLSPRAYLQQEIEQQLQLRDMGATSPFLRQAIQQHLQLPGSGSPLAPQWSSSGFATSNSRVLPPKSVGFPIEVPTYATCDFSAGNTKLKGVADFRQANPGMVEVRLNVTGLPSDGIPQLHGVHVHEYGDLSGGCATAGGHYNPYSTPHGAPTNSPAHRHVGDFGNVGDDGQGNIAVTFNDYLGLLNGEFSIIGRALLVHELEDDLGLSGDEDSVTNGNAGSPLGCCVLAMAAGSPWETL